MAESYSVQAVLSAVDQNFTSTMNKANGSMTNLQKGSTKTKTSIADIAKGVGSFKLIQMGASAARASLDKAFGRLDTMEQFDRTMTRMTGSSTDANKALDRLSDATTGTAYGLDVAAKSTQDFVTRGMHIGDATQSVEAWMDAVAFYGQGTNDQLESVMDALGKMRTKGTVEMDQLNRLFDVGIDAVGMYAKAVGRDSKSVQDDLTNGKISANDFLTTVEKAMMEGTNGVQSVAGAAKEAGASWNGTFDNMKAATTRGMASIIQEIDGGLTNGALPDMRTGLLASAKGFEQFLKLIGKGTGTAVKIAAPGIKLVADNLDVIGVTAGTAAAGYATFKGVMAAQDVYHKAVSSINAARTAIDNIHATYGVLTLAVGKNTTAEYAELAAVKSSAKAKAVDAAATNASEKATYAETTATMASSGAISVKTLLVGVLTGKIKLAEAAQILWNAALKANPIGVVIGLVTAFVGVVAAATKTIAKHDTQLQKIKKTATEASEKTEELTSSVDSSSESYDANVRAIDAQGKATKTLVGNLEELAAKEDKSKKDKQLMQQYVDSLNSSVDGLNLSYNEELDMLSMSTEAINAKVDAYKEQAQAQASQERYVEMLKEQQEVSAQLKETEDALNEATQKYNDTSVFNLGVHHESKKAVEELQESKTSLKQKEDELSESLKTQEGVMAENAAKAAESAATAAGAVSEGVEKQVTSLEDLSDTQQSVVTSLNESWQSYVDQATNMFDTLSNESELTVAEMTENLNQNQQVISEWADNIAILAERGVDEGLLQQLRDAGPESAGAVKTMVDSSDAELQGLSDAFANGGQTATDALKTAFDVSGVPESAMNLVTKTRDSMEAQIAGADFSSLGKAVPDGYTEGIEANSGQASEATGGMVEDGISAAQSAQNSHSPSVVYHGLGADAVAGYAQGVNSSSGQINSAMTNAIQGGLQAAEKATTTSMTGISKATDAAFKGMATSAKSGMTNVTTTINTGMTGNTKAIDAAMKGNSKAVKSGMDSMTKDVTTGMRNQNTQVTTGMRQIQAAASSGTSGFVRTIASGMNSSVNAVTSGKSRMVAQVNTLQSSFYSAGVNASRGLANGVNAGSGSAIAAARNVANSVAATMRSALQIHSPSKVTEKIGEYTGEGAAIGLLNMLSNVRKASDRVANVMIPKPVLAGTPAYAGAGASYSGVSGGRDMRIVVPVYLDGREIARAEAPYSEAERNKRNKIKNRITKGER